jgi:hypothetical protein
MPLVAVQPDCPVQFERVERLMNVEGGGANIYRLLNRGSKPITGFTIAYLYPNGNGGSRGWNRYLRSGEYAEDTIEGKTHRLRPLNDALKDKLDLRGPMKGFVIYLSNQLSSLTVPRTKTKRPTKLFVSIWRISEKKSIGPIGNPQRRREVWTAGV